jgi:hypothetical protein
MKTASEQEYDTHTHNCHYRKIVDCSSWRPLQPQPRHILYEGSLGLEVTNLQKELNDL